MLSVSLSVTRLHCAKSADESRSCFGEALGKCGPKAWASRSPTTRGIGVVQNLAHCDVAVYGNIARSRIRCGLRLLWLFVYIKEIGA